jgi:hypothetical protein
MDDRKFRQLSLRSDSKLPPVKREPRYAYVFALFLGDNYVPGVLIMAHTLQRTGTKHDIVCMVTPDVSEKARQKIASMGVIVYPVEYIITNPVRDTPHTQSTMNRYPNINKYHTKWNCLKLVHYDKVVLLDVDALVVRNMDGIFKINAPAGVIRKMTRKNGKKIITCPPAGGYMPEALVTDLMFNNHTGIDGGCMLVSPSLRSYNGYLDYARKFDLHNGN